MIIIRPNRSLRLRLVTLTIPVLLMFLSIELLGQEPPPRPIKVTVVSNLGFGTFYQGATGGTVTVNTTPARVSTGDVVLLGIGTPFSAAVYRITGNPGRIVSILNPLDILLPGSNGGSMNLHIGASNPPSPFVTTAGQLLITIGGTLTVGAPASNPPGTFSGSFNITFIQE
jgi:hypothetical protein